MRRIVSAAALALASIVGTSVNPAAVFGGSEALAACLPGEVLDDTTVADARTKIEAAGFEQVKDLRKGCDNFWHATAMKDGQAVRVVLTPDGKVIVEKD